MNIPSVTTRKERGPHGLQDEEERTAMMNMMYGFGIWWLIGTILMVLFWIAVILLVIWAVRSLFPRERPSGHDQALETLRQRYAKGEINAAEYEQARARLEETPVGYR